MKYFAFAGFLIAALSIFFLLKQSESPIASENVEVESEEPAMAIATQDTVGDGEFPFQRTEAEWKQILTSKQYRILRDKGTELPYVNEYNSNKREGIYVCAGCGQELYSSAHKYDSGTGWPSFWKPIADSLVAEREDNSLFMTRTEIVCSNCGGHLGHVFDDGPQPTGLRYCMNSAAMKFIGEKELSEN